MKDYLFVNEGFVYESPKFCMKMAFKVVLMDEEKTVKALEMIDIRLKSEYLPGRRFRRNLPAGRRLLETYG